MKDNKFYFWSPVAITKAKDDDGEEVMRLGGIASDNSKDTDGENLDYNGFQLDYFKKNGFINYHHLSKDNPNKIIGEPSKAQIQKGKGLYIECDLYKDSTIAKEVYKLAQVLEKNSKTRRLGFSIEGKVLERDPLDAKKITKAKITGCAVTFAPKNGNTFANIIKGELGEEPLYEEEIEESPEITANGGQTQIIAEVNVGGNTITIDKDGKVVYKALSTDSASGKALKPEEVEGKEKLISKSKESSKQPKELTKGEVFDKLFNDLPDIEIEKAEKLYKLISKISTMSTKTKKTPVITDDTITKAYKALGIENISKAKDDEDEEETEKADEDEEEEDAEEVQENDEETSEEVDEDEVENDDEDEEEEEEEKVDKKDIKKSKKTIKKAEKEDDEEDVEKDEEEQEDETPKMVKKSMKKTTLKKSDKDDEETADDMKKGGDSKGMKKLQNLIIEKAEENKTLFKSVGIVLKDLKSKNEKQQEKIDSLEKALEDSLNAVPERKSFTKPRERFDEKKKDTLEKGEKTLSIKTDKKKILNLLEICTFEKGGVDNDFGMAMTSLESNNHVGQPIRQRLLVEKGFTITN